MAFNDATPEHHGVLRSQFGLRGVTHPKAESATDRMVQDDDGKVSE